MAQQIVEFVGTKKIVTVKNPSKFATNTITTTIKEVDEPTVITSTQVNNYILYLVRGTEIYDITEITGNYTWRDSIDTLGSEFNFDTALNTNDIYFPTVIPDIKDYIVLKNGNTEIFSGKITDENITSRINKSFVTFDFAFYLNQSKIIKQYNKIKASEAIRQLCISLNVPIGSINEIRTIINKIYREQTAGDIIRDILDQATKELGIKYRIEMRAGKLYILPYKDLIVNPKIRLYDGEELFITDLIGKDISHNRSIQEMKNSIIVISGDEKSNRVVATAQDQQSIQTYGLLQEIITVDEKDIAQARNIAKNTLADLNRIQEDISVNILGSDDIRAGRILELNEPDYGLIGQYLITDCTHAYNNGIHRMSLNLGVL